MLLALALLCGQADAGAADGGVSPIVIPVTKGWVMDARLGADGGTPVVGGCWLNEMACIETARRSKVYVNSRKAPLIDFDLGGWSFAGGIAIGVGVAYLMWWLGLQPPPPTKGAP